MREIKRQFRQAVKCGLGSAYFIIRDNPAIDFSHDIIKASLSNFAIDAQCEGDRAIFLAQLIDIAKQKEAIIARILTSLTDEQNNFWGWEQLFELAAIFAKRGNKRARHAIYKRFRDNKINVSEGCGEDAIVELDGFKGLVFIIKARGKELLENNGYCGEHILIECFQDDNPKINVYVELEKVAAKNEYVRKYLDIINKYKLSLLEPEPDRKQKYTYSKIKDNIEKMIMFPVPSQIGKDLTADDIKKLADDFQRETNPAKQEKYLRVFGKVKYPNDYKVIMDIAKSQNNPKNRLVGWACDALSHFKTDEIRQFAMDRLQETTVPSDYLPLLISNYKNGDEVLLKEIASRHNDFDYIHSLAACRTFSKSTMA